MFNLRVFSIIFVLSSVTLLIGFKELAIAQGTCFVTFFKVATPNDGTLFPFEYSVDGTSFADALTGGSDRGLAFLSNINVTELPVPGWAISDIECVTDEGGVILFNITQNGFTAECTVPSSSGACTFFNVRTERPIPTLSEWGMISAAAGLGLIGLFFAIRRKRTAA
jgi:hypothetical protein